MLSTLIIFLILLTLFAIGGVGYYMTKKYNEGESGPNDYKISVEISSSLTTVGANEWKSKKLLFVDTDMNNNKYLMKVVITSDNDVPYFKDNKLMIAVGLSAGYQTIDVTKFTIDQPKIVPLIGRDKSKNISIAFEYNENNKVFTIFIKPMFTSQGLKDFTLDEIQTFPKIRLYYFSENAALQTLHLYYYNIFNELIANGDTKTIGSWEKDTPDPDKLLLPLRHV